MEILWHPICWVYSLHGHLSFTYKSYFHMTNSLQLIGGGWHQRNNLNSYNDLVIPMCYSYHITITHSTDIKFFLMLYEIDILTYTVNKTDIHM